LDRVMGRVDMLKVQRQFQILHHIIWCVLIVTTSNVGQSAQSRRTQAPEALRLARRQVPRL